MLQQQPTVAAPAARPERFRITPKAAELIGKMLGVFTDKVNIKGAIPVVISGGDELED